MITKNYIERPSKRHLKFKDLEVGQIFLDDCGDLYMKVRNSCDVNAIDLECAEGYEFSDYDDVRLINKEINITFSDDDIVDWTAKKED